MRRSEVYAKAVAACEDHGLMPGRIEDLDLEDDPLDGPDGTWFFAPEAELAIDNFIGLARRPRYRLLLDPPGIVQDPHGTLTRPAARLAALEVEETYRRAVAELDAGRLTAERIARRHGISRTSLFDWAPRVRKGPAIRTLESEPSRESETSGIDLTPVDPAQVA